MPETLNVRERSTPEWAAMAALADVSEEVMQEAFVKRGDGTLTVELRINGVEVPFATIINRLKEEAVRWSYERAREILEDRATALSDTFRRLEDLARQVEEDTKREVRKILPEAMTSEDYR